MDDPEPVSSRGLGWDWRGRHRGQSEAIPLVHRLHAQRPQVALSDQPLLLELPGLLQPLLHGLRGPRRLWRRPSCRGGEHRPEDVWRGGEVCLLGYEHVQPLLLLLLLPAGQDGGQVRSEAGLRGWPAGLLRWDGLPRSYKVPVGRPGVFLHCRCNVLHPLHHAVPPRGPLPRDRHHPLRGHLVPQADQTPAGKDKAGGGGEEGEQGLGKHSGDDQWAGQRHRHRRGHSERHGLPCPVHPLLSDGEYSPGRGIHRSGHYLRRGSQFLWRHLSQLCHLHGPLDRHGQNFYCIT